MFEVLFGHCSVNLSDELLVRFLTRFLARILTRVSGREKTINIQCTGLPGLMENYQKQIKTSSNLQNYNPLNPLKSFETLVKRA